jgi:hypothetical protein
MSPRYRAYLLRHWQLANGRERVEVQQIQTGERTHYRTLAEACAWLTARARDPTQELAAIGGGSPQPGGAGGQDRATPGDGGGPQLSACVAKEGRG